MVAWEKYAHLSRDQLAEKVEELEMHQKSLDDLLERREQTLDMMEKVLGPCDRHGSKCVPSLEEKFKVRAGPVSGPLAMNFVEGSMEIMEEYSALNGAFKAMSEEEYQKLVKRLYEEIIATHKRSIDLALDAHFDAPIDKDDMH